MSIPRSISALLVSAAAITIISIDAERRPTIDVLRIDPTPIDSPEIVRSPAIGIEIIGSGRIDRITRTLREPIARDRIASESTRIIRIGARIRTIA